MSEKKTLTNADIESSPVGRRSALGIMGAVGAAVAAVGVAGTAGTAHAIPGCPDRDPQDAGGNGRGRGISDSNPTDPAGCGSRACSDSDPSDPASRGRHC